eukprot:763681-Hanusia_phi.AAC.10
MRQIKSPTSNFLQCHAGLPATMRSMAGPLSPLLMASPTPAGRESGADESLRGVARASGVSGAETCS